jgi:L-seryl-tRNA(Ser) seleniumtransferase
VGGGSVPNHSLPSYAVAFDGNVNALEEALRLGLRPIIGRIHDGKFLLDVRTLFEADFPTIVEAIREAVL